MKGKMKTVIGCTASMMALSMFTSMAALAEENTGGIENSVWSYRAVANVTTQVNIRAYASTDSAIIGYLPKAGSADVIERGEEWSHVISNGVEGYIKNEYLAFGAEAKELAEVYGASGVKTNWDDVRVFSAPTAAAQVLATAGAGQSYEVISDNGDWISIQLDDSTMAYVPSEDVEKTILLDKAIPVTTDTQSAGSQGAQAVADQTAGAQSSSQEGQNQTEENSAYSQQPETESSVSETENASTEAPSAETSSTESYAETPATEAATETEAYTETPSTEAYTESPATEAASTEAPAEEPSEETVTSASADDVSLLAALIYCEAGNQSRDGKVAVGAVVLHRVASSSFANTINGVIYQSGQFTPAYSGALSSALANGVPSDCYEAAQAALNGEDPVPGALYFNTGSGKGVKIGDHQFY